MASQHHKVCVASGRGKGCKHTTIRQKRGVDVEHNHFVMFAIVI
jgi:hypothetical protein